MDTAADKKNTVLIVDDEQMNLNMLSSFLSKDYIIRTASGGTQALESAFEDPPDLILLDVMMPEPDGYEVLSALKKDDRTWKIPVIFITGLDSKEDEEKGLAMNAADYISKPLSMGIVKLRVKNQLQIVNQIRTIEALSLIDQLTGIPNRRNLDNRFAMEWTRAYREKQPLSLMMMDIDKFKVFNDTYGHLVGDDVLKLVAASFEDSLKRKSDFAARFGGEEFSVLLPNTALEGALDVAENIRRNIERLVIPCGGGKFTSVTMSIGVYSAVPAAGDEVAQMIAKADQALYTAKETGRNRVCVYGGGDAGPTDEAAGDGGHSGPPQGSPDAAVTTDAPDAPVVHSAPGLSESLSPQNDIMDKLAHIDGINVESGMNHFGGMEDLYIETMKDFTGRLPDISQAMQQALDNGDIKQFSISVHTIKSMLATVGASGMSRRAAKLEEAGKSGNADFCCANYPGLHAKLSTLHSQLSELF